MKTLLQLLVILVLRDVSYHIHELPRLRALKGAQRYQGDYLKFREQFPEVRQEWVRKKGEPHLSCLLLKVSLYGRRMGL